MNLIYIIVPVVIVVLAVAVYFLNKQRTALKTANLGLSSDLTACRSRYLGIANLEEAIAQAAAAGVTAKQQLEIDCTEFMRKKTQLETEYQGGLTKYNALRDEVALYEEKLDDISFGLYEPHFQFQASTEYRLALENLRSQTGALVKAGQATTAPREMMVGGNRREGERLSKLMTKTLLRSFNGECEGFLADVAWNNITKIEERVRKAFIQVNALGETLRISILPDYLELKLNEVRLAYEYEQKKHQEQEEMRAAREKAREESKAQEEIEVAKEEAESAEALYQRLLEQARQEAAAATGAQLQELTNQVATFEAKLDEARKKKEKAISRAQLTKSGFVYVISNIGAFGEGVYKIGLTRRIEPLERIAELSGASVPFPFDLHAMMFSMNAPELESALHKHFEERKLNLVNNRKEFFHNVDLSEIETVVREKGLSAQFVEYPEAREYRETLAQRAARQQEQKAEPQFAQELF
jgi:hypothetical protein